MFIVICLIILVIGYLIYYFYYKNKKPTEIKQNNQIINNNELIGNTKFLYTFIYNTSTIDNNGTISLNGRQLGIPLSGVYLVTTSSDKYFANAIVSFFGTNDLTNVSLITYNGIFLSGNYNSGKVLSITNNTGSNIQLTLYFQLLGPIARNSFYSSQIGIGNVSSNNTITYDAATYGITVLGTYLVTVIPSNNNNSSLGVAIVCFGLNENGNLTLYYIKNLHNYNWNFSLDMNVSTGISNLRLGYTGGGSSSGTLYFQLLASVYPNDRLIPFYTLAYTTTSFSINEARTYYSTELGIKIAGVYLVSINIGKWNETAILFYRDSINNLDLITATSLLGHGIIINSNNKLLQINNLTNSINKFTLYFLRIG